MTGFYNGDQIGDDPLTPGVTSTEPANITWPTTMQNVAGNYIKQGDNWPAFTATLCDANGPVDLTTATTIAFKMLGLGSGTLITGTATAANASAGQIAYTWVSGNTSTPDIYNFEITVTFSGGQVVTFPDYGYLRGEVYASL